jgi:predicted HD phosphohydrolase
MRYDFPASLDEFFAIYESRGRRPYGSESVTELEHARQCAELARPYGDAAVVAAFFHDLGRLADPDASGEPLDGTGTRHASVGADLLARRFPRTVVEPVRLHVAAKRALCLLEPGYVALLSPESRAALDAQGGPLTPLQLRRFRALAYAEDALRLRRADDRAKIPGGPMIDLADVRAAAERLVAARTRAG